MTEYWRSSLIWDSTVCICHFFRNIGCHYLHIHAILFAYVILSETLDIYNMWYRKQGLSVHLNCCFSKEKKIFETCFSLISPLPYICHMKLHQCLHPISHLTFYKTRTLWPNFIEIDTYLVNFSVLFSYCHLHKPEFHQTNITVHTSYLSGSAPTKLGHSDLFSQKLTCQLQWFSWMGMRLVITKLWVQPLLGWQHSFMEIDHEIFSTVILSLPLIQEGLLSVLAKEYAQILVNSFEDSKPAQ